MLAENFENEEMNTARVFVGPKAAIFILERNLKILITC